jgi:Tfp pilus assembly protein PilF
MFLLVVSLFFGFLKISIPGLPLTSLEVSPSHRATFEIASQTLKNYNPPVSWFFGSGPGTFVFDYSKFKSKTLNQTNFWAVRFSSGSSEILDRLATTGILGLISLLAILIMFFWLAIKHFALTIKPLSLGIFAGWLGVTVCLFFYPANLSLSFLFWVFIASFIALVSDKFKEWTFESSSRIAILTSFIFVFVLILGVSLLFLAGQRYLAEVRYFQGLEAVQRGDNQTGINYLLRAISYSGGKQDNYWRDISQIYLFRINEELQRKDLSKEEISGIITPLLTNVVGSARAATDASPKNVANWTVRGFVYRNLTNLIGGADEWAIKSYEEAVKLEPANPYLYTELGRVYLAKNDFEKAKENFQKAIDLKADYAPAHFQLAMVFVAEGKTDEAIEKLEATKQVAPFDQGLAFQLGMIYYQKEDFDKARGEFERAVSLDPNYSNARYFLGLIYDRQKQKEKAIEQFEKIAELNPDNEEVKKILANLRMGKPALEGITPAQPPIEEKPPERLEK